MSSLKLSGSRRKAALLFAAFLLLIVILLLSSILPPRRERAVLSSELNSALQRKRLHAIGCGADEALRRIEDPVLDTVPPILLGASVVTVRVGAKDIPGPLICIDNIDRDVSCELRGSYSTDRPGTYKLKRVACDFAGNISQYDFTLRVVKKLQKPKEIESTPLPFSEALKLYGGAGRQLGIDVSKWQGKIDWKRVAGSGAKFAMLRLGVQKGIDGELREDEYFLRNYKGAKAAGLKVGAYFYSCASTKAEAREQAAFALKILKKHGCKLDLPLCYDWESWTSLSELHLSLRDFNETADAFLSAAEKAGYKGALYTSKFYLENGLWTLDKYPVWVACYRESPYIIPKELPFRELMWQCSASGRIDGIDGDTDIDILFSE